MRVHCGKYKDAWAVGWIGWRWGGMGMGWPARQRSSRLYLLAKSVEIHFGNGCEEFSPRSKRFCIRTVMPRQGNGRRHAYCVSSPTTRRYRFWRRSSDAYGDIVKCMRLSAPSPESRTRHSAEIFWKERGRLTKSGSFTGSGDRGGASSHCSNERTSVVMRSNGMPREAARVAANCGSRSAEKFSLAIVNARRWLAWPEFDWSLAVAATAAESRPPLSRMPVEHSSRRSATAGSQTARKFSI